ncbi:GNAT family N-acetyltransferase [Nocardioides sp. C4-1]|uniref:GNAT family N-acetyltransferase n=1 Tax=Nocardioides sp. C4-1 TaxID=3151851 RepID=UPI0032642142
MPPTDDAEVLLRPATPDDAAPVAAVHLASRRAGAMPPGVHPDHEVEAWLAGRLAVDETWVAEAAGRVVGYVRMTATWLDDLYVAPSHAGQGIGSMLLDLAKARRPGGFSLWVFESNAPARAFYRRHGLVEREHTDGADNEEQEPDLRMSWRVG